MAEQKVKLTQLPPATDTIDTAELLVNQNETDQRLRVTHFLRAKNSLSDVQNYQEARANLNVLSVDEVNDKLSGFIDGDNTFAAGASLASPSDFIWDAVSNAWYYWAGDYPKAVPAASTPESTGGFGPNAWVSVGDSALRSMLASNSGASMIGTESGDTVQEELGYIQNNLMSSLQNLGIDHSKQSVVRFGPRKGESGDIIASNNSISPMSVFPQGIAVDELTGEIFITRSAGSGSAPAYLDIYNDNFEHAITVEVGIGWAEGVAVGYVDGERRIALSYGNTGYAIFILPQVNNLSSMQKLEPLFIQVSANHVGQISSYGGYVIIENNNLSQPSIFRRGLYSVFSLPDFLSSPDPVRVSFICLPGNVAGNSFSDSRFMIPKVQGIALTPYGVCSVAGQGWHSIDPNRGQPSRRLRYTEVMVNGTVSGDVLLNPETMLSKLDELGLKKTDGSALDYLEPEGICYSNRYGLMSLYVTSEMEVVSVNGRALKGKIFADFRKSVSPQGFSQGSLAFNSTSSSINTITGQAMSNADDVCDYMKDAGLRMYSFWVKPATPMSIGGTLYTTEVYVVAENLDDNAFRITVFDRGAGRAVNTYHATGSSPRGFVKDALVLGGSSLSAGSQSVIQISPQNFAQIRYAVTGTSSNTPLLFTNANGTVGSVGMSATATVYATTSDERLKVRYGKDFSDALKVIDELVDTGAVDFAAFKSDPDNVQAMFMAQSLQRIAPYAVLEGEGENPHSEEFSPKSVDYSKLVPLLIIALHKLAHR